MKVAPKQLINSDKFFEAVSLLILISLFLKSIIDIDGSWDTWNYHLPFAARLWGIVTENNYVFTDQLEYRFDGFPLLANFIQGFFWFTFKHVQATNLVSFISFIAYLCFIKKYLQVPLYLSAIALLAVPLVQIHVTSSYVDLFANICTSILVIMTYLLYARNNFYNKRNFMVAILAAFFAANTKMQLIPIVMLILCFFIIKIILVIKSSNERNKIKFKKVLAVGIASIFVFAVPIKNTLFYGNPAYPVKLEILGTTLNYEEDPRKSMPNYLKKSPQFQRWIYSVLEINTFDKNRPRTWTIGQGNLPNKSKSKAWKMGGYFGIYVVFNVVLLGYMFCKFRCRESSVALIVFTLMSIITSTMIQSHLLRYYMYWVICLISLNLHLIVSTNYSIKKLRIVNIRNIRVAYLLFLACVVALTSATYILPRFYTLEKRMQGVVDQSILNRINEGDRVCIVNEQPNTFLYASKFHPPSTYLIKEAKKSEECGSRRVIQ